MVLPIVLHLKTYQYLHFRRAVGAPSVTRPGSAQSTLRRSTGDHMGKASLTSRSQVSVTFGSSFNKRALWHISHNHNNSGLYAHKVLMA